MSANPLQNNGRSAAPTASRTRFDAVDPAAVMRIKNLAMRAKVVVEGFYNGLHRSPFHGFSVEFSEFRPYTSGDDPRGLDWKVYARTDRYYIKRFEDETNRRCYLVLDRSRSMGYGSGESTKIEYARTLVASLAYYLTLQRDSVGLLTFDESVGEFLSARNRPGHFHQLMVNLSRDVAGRGTDIAAPLEQMATMIRKRGMVVLVSDLLVPPETLRTNLGYLRSRGHEVMIIRTLDPAELELQLPEPGMVVDLETGQEIYLDPEAARDEYRQRFDEHRQQLQAVADGFGVTTHTVTIDQPLDRVLFDIVNGGARSGRGVARGGAIAAASRGSVS